MSVGVCVARFDDEREAHDDGLGRVEVVGIALQPHKRAGPRPQLVRVDRLGQKIVGARVDAANPVLTAVSAR